MGDRMGNNPTARTTVSFSVGVTGTAPFTYQWRKNGANLSASSKIIGVTSAVLTITNVLAADAASYSAVVSNPAGSATSSSAILTVTDPLITSQPAGRTNNLGDNANFSVTADGTTPFTYQWQFNGANISGATSTAYIRTNLTAADAGTYKVIVSGAGSTTSTDAPLSIPYPVGYKVAQWDFNSSPSDSNTTTGKTTPSVGSGTMVGDNGVLVNKFSRGTGSDPAELILIAGVTDNSGVSTTNYPAATVSNKTAGVQFSVSTVGMTNIAVTWEELNNANSSKYFRFQYSTDGGSTLIDGTLVTNDVASTTQYIYHSADLTGIAAAENNANFTFRIVSEWESTAIGTTNDNYVGTSGTYSGSGTGGLVRFDMVTVLASVAPTITSNPVSLVKEFGETATFNVAASGAALSYHWQKGAINLSNGGNVSGATTSALTLSNVSGPDDGSYRCVVSNVEGSATSTDATLLVHDPVITVQPASATIECDTAGTLTVTAAGTGPLAYQWYTPDANGTAVSGANSSVLTNANVHGSTTYVVVVSSIYGSVTSSSASLTAQDTTPPVVTVTPGSSIVATGGNYSDPGATANDSCDGSLSVTPSGTVNANVAGSYTLTYTAIDAANNTGVANRVVEVVTPVSITGGPTPLAATNAQGTNFTIAVAVAGSDPKTYQWYTVEGGIVPGATSATNNFTAQPVLTPLATDTKATNHYYLVVSNALNTVTSPTNKVVIILDKAPPHLTLTSPAKNGVYTSGTPVAPAKAFAVAGTASDDAKGNIAHVYYHYINLNTPNTSTDYEALPLTQPHLTSVGDQDVQCREQSSAVARHQRRGGLAGGLGGSHGQRCDQHVLLPGSDHLHVEQDW